MPPPTTVTSVMRDHYQAVRSKGRRDDNERARCVSRNPPTRDAPRAFVLESWNRDQLAASELSQPSSVSVRSGSGNGGGSPIGCDATSDSAVIGSRSDGSTTGALTAGFFAAGFGAA